MFKLESYRKGIALSTIFNAVNKGLIFLISVVAIYFFGAEGETGIYFYAYNTVFFIATFITNLNAAVIIPESMRIRLKHGEREALLFLNSFIFLYTIITCVLCLLFYLGPVQAFLVISRFDSATLTANAEILFWSIPLIALITMTNLFTDILVSHKYFTAPMLIGIFNGACAILSIFLFHSFSGIKSLLVGLIVAYCVSLLVLVYFMHKKLSWTWQMKFYNIEVRIWKNAFFAQIGNLTSTLVVYMPFYLLSGFGSGIITAINIAQQVAGLPTSLISNQFSSVAAIKFNELAASGNENKIGDVFLRAGSLLLFLLIPCTGFFYLYGDSIVHILFGRGQKAAEWNTLAVEILKILSFSIPLLVINTLMARLFMAVHRIMEGFWLQTILNIIYIVALIIAVGKFGIIAYPFAYVGIYVINALMGIVFQYLFFPYLKVTHLLKYFGVLSLINGAICMVLVFLRLLWKNDVSQYVDFTLGAIVYLGLLFIAGALLRVQRLTDIRF